jgi:hypothetical protein
VKINLKGHDVRERAVLRRVPKLPVIADAQAQTTGADLCIKQRPVSCRA